MPNKLPEDSGGSAPLTAVVRALGQAIAQMPKPEMRGVLWLALGWTLLALALLWIVIALILGHLLAGSQVADWPIAQWSARILGVLAGPILTVMLFPFVATAMSSLYCDRVAECVETRHYALLPPPPATRWGDQLRSALSLAGLSILLNLAILPLYLILPVANLVLFTGINGYLLGRSYFDLAALRRLDWMQARALWRLRRFEFWLLGAATAMLFGLPVVGLISPLIATAASVHLLAGYFARHPQAAPDKGLDPGT